MGFEKDVLYIEKVLAGDSSSYKYLVDNYKDQTFSLVLSIVKNNEDAEEVAQDAFIKAYKNLNSFKKESSFSTWLYRIAYNAALTKIRSKKPVNETLDNVINNFKLRETNNAFIELIKEDRKKYLLYALDKLKAEEKLILQLFYTEEKDLPEIAKIIGTTHGSIRVKILRARNKLKDILDGLLNNNAKEIL